MGAISCRHCNAITRSSVDVARLQGWRMFVGESQSGKALDDVVCPACAGTATEPVRGWAVRCNTCDWYSAEDDEFGDEDVTDARRARELAREHECEPDMEIQPPGDSKWHRPEDFNDDGTPHRLRGQPLTADEFALVSPGATT